MAGEDIKTANHVRQILSRHYIKPRLVKIMVGRGTVRIIGRLERTEARADAPIDEDYIHKLKNEIRRIPGVRTVNFTIKEDEEEKENLDGDPSAPGAPGAN